MSIAIAVGLLTAAAVYLFMQRGMVRIVLGFILASHAANLMFFAAGNPAYRAVPYIDGAPFEEQADPLPQAFVLTAIVIAFAITMYMVTLAITTTTDDDTENDEESPAKVLYGARRPRPVGPPADAGISDTGDTEDVAVKGVSTESGEIAVESGDDETGETK